MNIAAIELLYKARCKILLKQNYFYEELNDYNNFFDILTEEEFDKIMRLKHNRQQKRCRIDKKIKEMILFRNSLLIPTKLIFGTLTLDNKHLNQKEDTYIRKIHKWIKEHNDYAILNKDYGKKTEREHYHFIGLTREELEETEKKSKKGFKIYEFKIKNYTLGFEPDICIIDVKDKKQMREYLLKLNNHSHKITSRNRVRIIKNPLMRMYELKVNKTQLKNKKSEL